VHPNRLTSSSTLVASLHTHVHPHRLTSSSTLVVGLHTHVHPHRLTSSSTSTFPTRRWTTFTAAGAQHALDVQASHLGVVRLLEQCSQFLEPLALRLSEERRKSVPGCLNNIQAMSVIAPLTRQMRVQDCMQGSACVFILILQLFTRAP